MAKKNRKEMTLADYLVIALSPALIMTLVGSLVFFLLEISYSGQYRERMLWVLGWFVFGAVLVARIAIQEGREHAAIFGYVLAGATGLVAMRYVDQFLVAFVLLGIIWWCAGKLTWDCTLIDDDQDASGEGLLQAAKLGAPSLALPESAPEETLDASHTRPHSPGIWVAYFSLMALPLFGIGQLLIPSQDVARRSYAFQLLITYVASGMGLLLATSFLGLRRYLRQRNLQMPAAMTASWLLMGSGLVVALLLIALLIPRPEGTYTLTALIDRADQKLKQASRFAVLGNDKGSGPGRAIGAADPKDGKSGSAESREQSSSKNAASDNKSTDSDKQKSSESSSSRQSSAGKQSQSGASPQQGQSRGENSKSSESGGSPAKDSPSGKDGKNSDQKSNPEQSNSDQKGNSDQKSKSVQESNSDQKSNSGQQSKSGDSSQNGSRKDQQSSAPEKSPSGDQPQSQSKTAQSDSSQGSGPTPPQHASSGTSFLSMIATYFKWLVYGALLLAGLILSVIYRERVLTTLAQLWHALLSLFHRQADPQPKPTAIAAPPKPLRPFASFSNPFLSGAHSRMSPTALVVYTFEALEAWSRERVKERPANQTPSEFAEMLSVVVPDLDQEIRQATALYASVAYGKITPEREAVTVLERLWSRLNDTQPTRPSTKTARSKKVRKP